MSRVYVFATRWVDRFWGDNAQNERIDLFSGNNSQLEIDIKTKCSSNDEIRFVGFDCQRFDRIGRSANEINHLIDNWTNTFKREGDEITFILHDKVLGYDGAEFKYQDGVYGFYHDSDEDEFISKFLTHCSSIPIEDCEKILIPILNIIPLYDEIVRLCASGDLIEDSLLEKYREVFDKANIQYNPKVTYGSVVNAIEGYVNSLIK